MGFINRIGDLFKSDPFIGKDKKNLSGEKEEN